MSDKIKKILKKVPCCNCCREQEKINVVKTKDSSLNVGVETIAKLQSIIGYVFQNQKTLELALIHK